MKRYLAATCAALALSWAQDAAATPAIISGTGTNGAMGTASGATGAATTLVIPTTADTPAGSLVLAAVSYRANNTLASCTDSQSTPPTYSAGALSLGNSSVAVRIFYDYTSFDLPAPCTVTATETSTTLVVTAVVSCSGTDVLTVGQAISGGSFTGVISAPCTLVAGAATCTITGGATVATPGTATISSALTCTYNSATGAKSAIIAAFSGMASSSQFDSASTTATGSSTGALSIGPTGTLAQASEVIFGDLSFVNNGAPTADAAFTSLGSVNNSTSNMHAAFKIVSATTAVTWAPSLTGSSGVWAAMLQAFKASGVGPAGCKNGLLMMGAGC